MSATESPSPTPTSAPVTASISRMPGPPAGPSLRMTITSPGLIAPPRTAAIASSSPSNTRAGPLWWRRSCPASLTTEPSGASEPLRMARPPLRLSGSDSGRTTRWPSVSLASRACSPIVLPVTVGTPSCRTPASSRRLATSPTPPARYRSTATYRPPGLQIAQQRRALADAVEVVDRQLDAGLVRDGEQVQHAVRRSAAGRDRGDRVLEALARDDLARQQPAPQDSTINSPAAYATVDLFASTAGTMAEPIGEMPMIRTPSPSCSR